MPAVPTLDPDAFDALTFDCYGTLIDWHAGILAVLHPWATQHRIGAADAELLAAYHEAEPAAQAAAPEAPYPDILRDVHGRIARRFGVEPSPADAEALAGSVGAWPPFPDSVRALAALGARYTLIVVSNVDHASFARTARQLGSPFDAAVLAEDVGAYKPDHAMFHRAFEVASDRGIARDRILHVAQSLFHDHAPAKALGMTTAWVDRARERGPDGAPPVPHDALGIDLVVPSMGDLAGRLLTGRA